MKSPSSQPKKEAGKGMRPVAGYNYRNWFKNFPTSMGPKKTVPKPKKDTDNARESK